MHGELVVGGDLQLAQNREPFGVVPFGGIRQLAELDIPRQHPAGRTQGGVALGELLGPEQVLDDRDAAACRADHADVERETFAVGVSSEQAGVARFDERLGLAECRQRGVERGVGSAGSQVVANVDDAKPELRRRDQRQQDVASRLAELEQAGEMMLRRLIGGTSQQQPVGRVDERAIDGGERI